jgi:hypothetical protein
MGDFMPSIFDAVEVIPRALDVRRKGIGFVEGGERRGVADGIEADDGLELRVKVSPPALGPAEHQDLGPFLFDEDDFLNGGDALVVGELVRGRRRCSR